jgi:hypothetical protein
MAVELAREHSVTPLFCSPRFSVILSLPLLEQITKLLDGVIDVFLEFGI